MNKILFVIFCSLLCSCGQNTFVIYGNFNVTTYSKTDTTCLKTPMVLEYHEDAFGFLAPFKYLTPFDTIELNKKQLWRENAFDYAGKNNTDKYLLIFPTTWETKHGIVLGIKDRMGYHIIATDCQIKQ